MGETVRRAGVAAAVMLVVVAAAVAPPARAAAPDASQGRPVATVQPWPWKAVLVRLDASPATPSDTARGALAALPAGAFRLVALDPSGPTLAGAVREEALPTLIGAAGVRSVTVVPLVDPTAADGTPAGQRGWIDPATGELTSPPSGAVSTELLERLAAAVRAPERAPDAVENLAGGGVLARLGRAYRATLRLTPGRTQGAAGALEAGKGTDGDP